MFEMQASSCIMVLYIVFKQAPPVGVTQASAGGEKKMQMEGWNQIPSVIPAGRIQPDEKPRHRVSAIAFTAPCSAEAAPAALAQLLFRKRTPFHNSSEGRSSLVSTGSQ